MIRAGAGRHRSLVLGAMALFGALVLFTLMVLRGAARAQVHPRALGGVSPSVEVVITSANLSQALTRVADIPFSDGAPDGPIIDVDDGARDQVIKGLGGAMTDTSAWLIHDKLSASTRQWLINALFGTSGIHLNFIRVPMGASDFTSGRKPWSYDDMPAGASDPNLVNFSIHHDTLFTIPVLKQALSTNPGMFVLANPWSPPGWMKTNGKMSNRHGRGHLKSSSMGPLAAYFVKFLQAYAREGIHVAAITPQNEPGQASIYPGMDLSETSEATFVRSQLAPALKRSKLSTKIYGYDWGWARSEIGYAASLARSPAATELAGISNHCYLGDPTIMAALHRDHPRLDEIVAECSPGIAPAPTSEIEIASMRNWASALALWNLALDPSGGPVQAPNNGCPHCTGIVTIDEATHMVKLTRDYYQLGQLSKFVQPGAVRIASNNFVTYRYLAPHEGIATRGLDDVAFENPDGSRVLVAYNGSTAPIAFGVQNDGRYFSYTLQAGATGTFVWDRPASQPPSVGSTVPPA
jgi:glucosylceramidase